MIDEANGEFHQTEIENQVVQQDPNPITTKKSNKTLRIILVTVAAVLCLCSAVCAVVFALGIGKAMVEKEPVEAVLDSYMDAMTAKDADRAYKLFSPRAQKQVDKLKLTEAIEGKNYILFEGYQGITADRLNLGAYANSNANLPQGTVANVNGTVLYEGGIRGNFTAVLEKVDGQWMIHSININVPLEKLP